MGAECEAPECRVVVLAGCIRHRVGCRLHPRNLHSLETISGFGSMEARNLELQVGLGSHGGDAGEN